MFPIKPILRFLVVFFVVFVVLILPWPGVRAGYAAFYRAIGNLCAAPIMSAASEVTVRFEPLAPGEFENQEGRDFKLTLHHRPSGIRGSTPYSTWPQGYVPTAFVIALILASPISWGRRLRALVIGLLLVTVFVAFRQAVLIASVVYRLEGFTKQLQDFAWWVFVESFAGVFVIPMVIWLIATFRRRDLEAMVRGKAAAPAEESHSEPPKKRG
jgi:hypothetical protein